MRFRSVMEDNVFYEGQIIWAQIDANRHLRHSAYADLCAQARSNMLRDNGLSLDKIAAMNIGAILFREELVYLREIHLNDDVKEIRRAHDLTPATNAHIVCCLLLE